MINDVCPNCKGTGKINNPRIHFVAFSLTNYSMFQVAERLNRDFNNEGRLVSVVYIPKDDTLYCIFDRRED
jgi:hypothetical protein